ncbi:hypothetical protein B0J11DRAFT_542088 [Dendryphion nanum]|uniref:FAD-binding PCMH-type domain-containing protein n=1 Tax=Dendryphion nanum TaxID=256645 RepID=A0A9P9D538_9PLEO|nr:hypothetical protein B0J11DRAFT_542088 [Dendryphion nanum]
MSNTQEIVDELKRAFPNGVVLLRGTKEFTDNLGQSGYMLKSERATIPIAVFRPNNTLDVPLFIKTVKPLALTGETQFAIWDAGQQLLPSYDSIEDGIIVDLKLLDHIEIKEDNSIVSIGAGACWGSVYNFLETHDLAVAGGTVGTDGIGQAALQGSLSLFSSREGFIADNVVNFEIVLASGDSVNANAISNPDLFRALKGGGNNFGIVTRFDMRTFRQGPIWGGKVFYPVSLFPSQIDTLVTKMHKSDIFEQIHLTLSVSFRADSGMLECMNHVYYIRDAEKSSEVEPFIKMDHHDHQQTTVRKTSLMSIISEQTQDVPDNSRTTYMNTTINADAATINSAFINFTKAINSIKSTEGLTCSFTLQPYPVSLLQKSASLGENSLGLYPQDGPLISIILHANWAHDQDTDQVIGTLRDVLEDIEEDAMERETAVAYKNAAFSWDFQDPISSYGSANKKMLQDVSKKFDPEGLFQKGVVGGFKLFVEKDFVWM